MQSKRYSALPEGEKRWPRQLPWLEGAMDM